MIKYNLRLQSNIFSRVYLFTSGLNKCEISDWIKHCGIHIGFKIDREVPKWIIQGCKEELTANWSN